MNHTEPSLPRRLLSFVRRTYRQQAERTTTARLIRQHAPTAFKETIDWDWSAIRYNRVAVIGALAAQRPDGAYLEIGCRGNATFDAVPMPTKVGVDPVEGGTVRATSDDFFRTSTQQFDLIFIDGLHTYEQVHRDLANALKVVRPGGWIAMHDMLPRNWIEEHFPPFSEIGWVGGSWKVGFELLQTGLDFRIVTVDHGVAVIRVNQPGVELADLSAGLGQAEFRHFYDNRNLLPLATWQEALPWIRQA